MTSVTVLTPTGRRQNVKCTPNYTILQVLEEVCKKHGLKAEEYDLTHHNHRLDTTNTIRFSGLPNNAFLEMAEVKNVRAESLVTLGLQLENGERKMGSFNPSDSLYFVLDSLVPEHSDVSQNPVVIYTRREIYGEENLKKTTLRNLGLVNGRAILRLIHRTPEQLRIQANVSSVIPAKTKEEPAGSPPLKMKKNETFRIKENLSKVLDVEQQALTKPQNIENKISKTTETKISKSLESQENNNDVNGTNESPEDQKLQEDIFIIGERNAIVFLHQSTTHPVLEDLPDEFYELSLNEVKSLLKDLQKKVRDLVDAPLVSSTSSNFEKDKKVLRELNMYKKTIIRVQFPDRIILQGVFQPLEKVSAVVEFVQSYLENLQDEFYLFTAPPKSILDPSNSLVEALCVPSVLLHFGTKNDIRQQKSFLKPEFLDKLTSFEGAQLVATRLR